MGKAKKKDERFTEVNALDKITVLRCTARNVTRFGALLFCLIFLFCGCAGHGEYPAAETPDAGAVPESPPASAATPTPQNPVYETPIVDAEIIFKDPYLRDVVREKIEKPLGSIYVSDVAQITSLTARVKGIRDIEDLRYFTALEELDLHGNNICDLSPLSSLTNLKKLDISQNYVGFMDKTGGNGMNLQPLSSLVRLETLKADKNGITDISPLAGLVNLKELNIEENIVTSLEALSRLTQLKELRAGKNRITDLSPLAGLVNLETLSLESNSYMEQDASGSYVDTGIFEITALEGLTALKSLNISYNNITSLAPVSALPNLEYLNAASNNLTDIECMRGSGVKRLNLENNKLLQFDAILEMPALEELWYQYNPILDHLALEIFLFRRDNPGQPLPPDLSEELAEREEEKASEDDGEVPDEGENDDDPGKGPEDVGEETEDGDGHEEVPGENPGGGNNVSSDPVSYDKIINDIVQQ